MARIVVDVKNTIGIEQGNITGTGTDSNPTRIHSVGFIPLEYTGSPPSDLTISAATSTGKTLNVSYVIYNTPNYTDISYDPDAWLSNPCTEDLSGKTNINYIATYAKYSDNSNIAPSDITSWTITYDNGTAFEIGANGYPVPIAAPEPSEYAMASPYPDSVWRIDSAYNMGYPYNMLMPDIPRIEPALPVSQRPYVCLYRFDTPQDGFAGHGMCVLTPTKCTITEELNGKYEFSMEHPIDPEGRWQYIRENAIIKAMGQLFTIRVVNQQWKGNSGKIVAKADHIWYQLGDRWLEAATNRKEGTGISSNSVATLVSQANAYLTNVYFSGDTHYEFTPHVQPGLQVPSAIGQARWAFLDKGTTPVDFFLGSNGVVVACGGEFHRDNFDFYINERKHGSTNNAFDIRVGKNMSGIKRTIDVSSLVTYVKGHTTYIKNGTTTIGMTFAKSWVDGLLDDYGIPHHIYREKEFSYNVPVNYWYTLDPPETIVEAMFKEDVALWFKQVNSPLISYEIDMRDVKNNPEYQELVGVDSYKVGNYGFIHDPHIGDIEIEITKTTLNAITGETEQVTFGNVRSFVGQPPEHLIIDPETVVTESYFQVTDSEGAFCFDSNGDMIVEYEGV